MLKFNDLNRTNILVPIIAFQLNSDNSLSFGWEIKLFLKDSSTITMFYPNGSANKKNYSKDCETLLNL